MNTIITKSQFTSYDDSLWNLRRISKVGLGERKDQADGVDTKSKPTTALQRQSYGCISVENLEKISEIGETLRRNLIICQLNNGLIVLQFQKISLMKRYF